MQVAELTGRLQEAEDNNASLLSKLSPTSVECHTARATSHSNLSQAEAAHTDGQSLKHMQRSNSAHSSAAESHQQLQTSDKEASSNLQHAADASPLLSGQLCKTLQQIADNLTADAAKLKKTAQQQTESDSVHNEGKPFNWGFPVTQHSQNGGNKAGPVRPATAAPSDGNRQRPRRQWSAQNRRQPDCIGQDADGDSQRPTRPLTAAGDVHQGAPRRGRGRRDDDKWLNAVPPTRMPAEVLRQAREDYIREKNRVRDKRLQELTQSSTMAEVTQI